MALREQFRITSWVVIGAFLLTMASSFLPVPKVVPPPAAEDGGDWWNPCSAWVSYGAMHSLASVTNLGALVLFTIQGLRGRSGPRWLAAVGFMSLVVLIEDYWWQVSGCYAKPHTLALCALCGSIGVMYLHHACRPLGRNAGWSHHAIQIAFLAILSTWFGVRQYQALAPNSREVADCTYAVQRTISLPAILLFLGSIAVTLYKHHRTKAKLMRYGA